MTKPMSDRKLPDEKLHDFTRKWGLARKAEEEAFAELYAYIELERCKTCPYKKENNDAKDR